MNILTVCRAWPRESEIPIKTPGIIVSILDIISFLKNMNRKTAAIPKR